jgi:hypothetical protein
MKLLPQLEDRAAPGLVIADALLRLMTLMPDFASASIRC